ncbi:MAG: low molecular weight phosphotyrosine protein phosphatase [Planctomycetes bacterium]|nr:low molecular weight phosphotyrosine protein phosphatase [Planctomycetota bacterium]
MTSVLFVCLGNICRSPLADAVFNHLVQARSLEAHYTIDSAGTSAYHAGGPADPRSIAVARKNGIAVTSVSRKVHSGDHTEFDWVIAMDRENLRDLEASRPSGATARLVLLREYDPEGGEDVPDPYYGGPNGFDIVQAMVTRSCERLLDVLEEARASAGS